MELATIIVALVALVIAGLSAWWSVKNYRARLRGELPEVRVWIPQLSKSWVDRNIPLSVQIHNPPLHSSWQITRVEALKACPTVKCFVDGDKCQDYFEFHPGIMPGEKRTLDVRPGFNDLILYFYFESPRKHWLTRKVVQEKRESKVIRVSW